MERNRPDEMRSIFNMYKSWCIFVLLSVFLAFGHLSPTEMIAYGSTSAQASLPESHCDGFEISPAVKTGVRGTEIVVRGGPGPNHEKRINKKLSSVLGKSAPLTIASGFFVSIQCTVGEWSYVRTINPDYLASSHVGWVPNDALVELDQTSLRSRAFTEEDVPWYEVTAPYKKVIVAGLNRIHAGNRNCKYISPASVDISKTLSRLGDPMFFVMCGGGKDVHTVYFSLSDIESGKIFSTPQYIEKMRAMSLCEGSARSAANHPSTVKISRILDYRVREFPNGRTRIDTTFKARNSFNLEEKFHIRCLLDEDGLIESDISEY